MSIFDPKLYESVSLGNAGSTEYANIPEDPDGYVAQCVEYKLRAVKTDNGDSIVYDTTWKIDDSDGRCAAAGVKRPQLRFGIFLELKADGSIDESPEANVKLNRFREAIGKATGSFQFRDAVGSVARLFVAQKRNEKTGETLTNVTRIEAL